MAKRSTYHHGDLRTALVTTALEVIAEQGIGALSVAEVARRAGVSSAAPYRHFSSRKALLIACAVTAARRLTDELLQTQRDLVGNGDQPDPVEVTAASAAAYTRFAAQYGSGFDLIFAGELQDAGDQDLLAAGREVMDAFLPFVLAVTSGDARSALQLLERQISAAHGYATLMRSGFYSRRQATTDDVAAHAAEIARSLARDAAKSARS
ncbi:TetR/AcrR family transcriptional regulator [Streptomyces sp. NPDC058382]|uniref:TetR/AcrR family transcriptional regulator n=1 Tax=unclassified Streptomyces TaxID=2593676 RepID=UPI003643147A